MKQNHICPFCSAFIPELNDTFKIESCYFTTFYRGMNLDDLEKDFFQIEMLKCPTCNEISYFAKGIGKHKNINIPLYPLSLARQFPEYVPKSIRNDYEEAYSILNLSPKASATLSRRCLQGMIRDFWNISKSNLYEEINAIKNNIPVAQWNAINAIRSIGNIGAHMEKDVNVIVDIESYEAEQLIKLIELLIDKWYISRHDEQTLLDSIIDIKNNKTSKKTN